MAPIFLQISFSWVEKSLQVEFHPTGLPRSGRFMVWDKKQDKQNKNKSRYYSVQLGNNLLKFPLKKNNKIFLKTFLLKSMFETKRLTYFLLNLLNIDSKIST